MIRKHSYLGLALAAAFFMSASAASALDFNDVKNLITNQVSESVIENMVRQDASLVITPAQADELRAIGASESLVAAIRRAPTVSGYADGSSYVVDETPRTVVTPSASKPQSFVATTGETYYLNPETGNYYQVAPAPAPTVVYEAPTVVYTTPRYVYPAYPGYPVYRHSRPSVGFSFSFGSSHRRGGYRGGPRGHRR